MIDLPPFARLAVLLVRPGMLVLAAPVFGGTYAPAPVKIGLTVAIALLLIPTVPVPETASTIGLGTVVAREAIIGLALAMAVRVLISGTEFAGQLAGFQLGFSYANLVDPQSGVRNNLLSSLYGTFALVIFLGVNAHHDVLRALAASYQTLPLGSGGVSGDLATVVARMLGAVFVLGVRLAAPVVIVLLIVELALGLLSRAAPALNLMASGFPVRVGVGLVVLAATIGIVPGIVTGAIRPALELAVRAAMLFR